MEIDNEDAEIMIEYNECVEADPLCDNCDIITENCVETPPVSENETIESSCETNVDYDMVQNEATWYKCVDIHGRYVCKHCELTYLTVQTLRIHIKTKHPEEACVLSKLVQNNKRRKKLKCHVCKKRFKEIHSLKDHFSRAHAIENVQTSCLYCDATFRDKKEMNSHLFLKHNTHTKNIHSCSVCGYRTTKKSHYKQHMNTHRLEKSKKCDHCNYCTSNLSNLKIHTRIHTNEKPYICDIEGCAYRSAAKSALRSHKLRHDREGNMLYCDKCNYKTVYKQSLKKHQDSHNRNTVPIQYCNV